MTNIGHSFAHYWILEKIGEGGMGVVYKADDSKLKRTVALKFLPSDLTRDPQAKARLIQEAQAAAALDHPNICAVFEIGEVEGAMFIAMPYVKGQSLKERIAKGPLPLETALEIASQVAEGLKEAHEKGIIHRDIKPANIMLTEKNQAKIMDFGLAKLASAADVTKTLGITGTIAYMSPEQARGEAVDRRTDVWSLGATLYEMLTGQMPFGRKHDQALIYSILHEAPEPLIRLRPEIPLPVERVVRKALEKDRTFRYQTMTEVLGDIKSARTLGRSGAQPENSIIVLPFENISADPEQEYFCDGMTEEIITDLSHVRELLVISRSSAMTFKGTKKTIPEIVRAVNVRYVLEGSVRKAGKDLRITAQLIDAATDAHIWAEKYSGSLEDIFAIQEQVSRSIVEALKLRLTPDEERQLRARPIPDVRAYDAYLRAYYEVWKFTPEGFDRAFRLLDQILKQAGEFALIHAGFGWFQALAYDFGISHNPDTLAQAERHATRALELEPALGLASCALGYVRYKQGNLPAYVKLALRAVALDRNPTALWMLAFSLAETGHLAEARRFADEAVAADPLNVMTGFARGTVEFFDGRFEEAASCFRRYLDIVGPDEPILLWWRAQALSYLGREDEAAPYFDKVIAMEARPLSALSRLWRLAAGGDRDGFLKALEPDTQLIETARTDEWFPNFIAACLARLGDHAGAIEWLERAVGWGFSNHRFLGELSPFLAPLRGDSRFQALIKDACKKEKALDVSL
jgi:serine/threonine protein kinase/tetratricopeptide (TPR) repeat protein